MRRRHLEAKNRVYLKGLRFILGLFMSFSTYFVP